MVQEAESGRLKVSLGLSPIEVCYPFCHSERYGRRDYEHRPDGHALHFARRRPRQAPGFRLARMNK